MQLTILNDNILKVSFPNYETRETRFTIDESLNMKNRQFNYGYMASTKYTFISVTILSC